MIVRGGVAKGEPGETRTSLMLRYTLTHPHASTIIAGTLHPEHLAENVQAIRRGPLSPQVYAEAKRRLSEAGVVPAAVA